MEIEIDGVVHHVPEPEPEEEQKDWFMTSKSRLCVVRPHPNSGLKDTWYLQVEGETVGVVSRYGVSTHYLELQIKLPNTVFRRTVNSVDDAWKWVLDPEWLKKYDELVLAHREARGRRREFEEGVAYARLCSHFRSEPKPTL